MWSSAATSSPAIAFGHGMLTTVAGSGRFGGSRHGFEFQSNARAMLRAYASRFVSGFSANLYSIIFRIDSNE